MTNHSVTDGIIRLQKLDLEQVLREKVEEAQQLFESGRVAEAEALVQNVEARARLTDGNTVPVQT